MKLAIWLFPCAAIAFAADPTTDVRQIWDAIEGLNRQPVRAQTFTDDSDAPAALAELYKTTKITYNVRPLPLAHPQLVISHEPWGEAQIVVAPPTVSIRNPRIAYGAVRFVTEDVAIVDASFVDWRPGFGRERTPLALVLRKEGELWKIASLRIVAER